jgi:hypothetical protein
MQSIVGERATEYVVGARSCHSSMFHPRPKSMVLLPLSFCRPYPTLYSLACCIPSASRLCVPRYQCNILTRSDAVPLLHTVGLSGIYIQRYCANSDHQYLTINSNRHSRIRVTLILPKQSDRQSWRCHRLPIHRRRAYSGTVQLSRTMRSERCIPSRPFCLLQRLV